MHKCVSSSWPQSPHQCNRGTGFVGPRSLLVPVGWSLRGPAGGGATWWLTVTPHCSSQSESSQQAYQRGQENPHLKMRALRLKEIWGLAQGQKRSCSGLWVRTTATAGLPAPGPGPGEGCGDRLYPGQVFPLSGSREPFRQSPAWSLAPSGCFANIGSPALSPGPDTSRLAWHSACVEIVRMIA